MIETFIDRLRRYPFPSAGVVARLATLREASTMRVRVTIRTGAESNSCVARDVVRTGLMAFLAGNLRVQSGQREAGLRVVESADANSLPIIVAVALKTVLPQPSLVLVLVASDAVGGDTKERFIEILDSDCQMLRR